MQSFDDSGTERLLRVHLVLTDGPCSKEASANCELRRYADGRIFVRQGDCEPEIVERHFVESYVVDPVYAEMHRLTQASVAFVAGMAWCNDMGKELANERLGEISPRLAELRALIEKRGW